MSTLAPFAGLPLAPPEGVTNRNSDPPPAGRGYAILAALILGVVLVFNLDTLTDHLSDRIELVALLPDASGVRVGSSVWVAGVQSGTVRRISFIGRGTTDGARGEDPLTVAVSLRLEAATADVVTRDSDVRASQVRFIGEPIIQIVPGSRGGAPVRDGDTLRARPGPGVDDLIDRGRRLPDALDSLLESMDRVNGLADQRAPEIERFIDRAAELADATDRLVGAPGIASLGALAAEGGLTTRLASLRVRVDSLVAAIGRAADRYGGSATSGRESLQLDALARNAAALGARLDTLRSRFDDGRGFPSRFARDSALQVEIRGVQAQMDTLTSNAVSIGLRMLLP